MWSSVAKTDDSPNVNKRVCLPIKKLLSILLILCLILSCVALAENTEEIDFDDDGVADLIFRYSDDPNQFRMEWYTNGQLESYTAYDVIDVAIEGVDLIQLACDYDPNDGLLSYGIIFNRLTEGDYYSVLCYINYNADGSVYNKAYTIFNDEGGSLYELYFDAEDNLTGYWESETGTVIEDFDINYLPFDLSTVVFPTLSFII